MGMRTNRKVFEERVRKHAGRLNPEARHEILAMLGELRHMAGLNALESFQKNKHMMYAYWKTIEVYAGHLVRLVVAARKENEHDPL